MPEAKSDEKRLSVEYLRLLSFFVDYLDRSTFITAFTFLGMVVTVIAPILYASGLLNYFTMVIITTYGGVTIVFASLFYRRILKRRFNRYLETVSRDTLMSDSEYRTYVDNIQRVMDSRTRELLSETAKREKELAMLKHNLTNLRIMNESLERKLEELQKAAREGKKAGESP